jgi:two-component system sensor histidine kinase VicK
MEDSESSILKLMTDKSDEVTFIFDPATGLFQYINAAFERVTKRKCAELLENPKIFFTIIHKEDVKDTKSRMKFLLKKKTNSLLDFRIMSADKNEKWIRVKVYPIIAGNKIKYITGTAEDDTVRIAGVLNMQKVNAWKNSTLEIISHDLRGPIGTIQILASLIAKKLQGNQEIGQLTKMITDISKRNITLIETLLKRETLDTAKVEISKERLDVVWEVHQAMDIYIKAQKNLEKQIGYTYSHEKIFAEVDSMKFLQIINNLVSNAIKFTKKDGNIKINIDKLETTFLITLTDDGIGIPKSLQPVLFNKYTRAGREGLHGEESVGLGMWIVRSLTEAHGGKVWFESEAKKGTTFYVEIPLDLWGAKE